MISSFPRHQPINVWVTASVWVCLSTSPAASRTVLPWNLSFLIALENSLLLGPLIWLTPPQPPRLDLNVPYLGKPSWHPEFLEVENNTLILHSKMAWVVGTRCCVWFLLQAELLVLFFLAVLVFIEHAPININSPLHLWKEKNDCYLHSSLSSSRPLWRESLLSIIFKEPFVLQLLDCAPKEASLLPRAALLILFTSEVYSCPGWELCSCLSWLSSL